MVGVRTLDAMQHPLHVHLLQRHRVPGAEEDVVGLRIYVKGGGCSGYQYGMSFESKMDDDDTVIEKGDVKVIVDSQSAPML